MNFMHEALNYIREEAKLFALFLGLSLFLALSEGLSVSLLIPILGAGGGGDTLSSLPVIGHFFRPLMQMNVSQRILTVSVLLSAVLVVRGGLQYATQILSATLPLRIQRRIMTQVFDLLMHVQLNYLHGKKIGELKTLIQEHPVRVATALRSIADIVSSFILIFIYMLLMIAISWQITIVTIGFVGVLLLILRWISARRLVFAGTQLSKTMDRMHEVFFGAIQGVKLVRLANAETRMSDEFTTAVNNFYAVDLKRYQIGELQSPLFMTLAGLFVCAILIFGALTQSGSAWVVLALMFIISLYRMLGPASRIVTAQVSIHANKDSFQRLKSLFAEATAMRQKNGTIRASGLNTGICFEDVTFSYPATDVPAVRNLSLIIPVGKMVALVGPSGSGKSTIVGLVARLFDPQKGRIMIDGEDLKDLEIGSWRRRIGTVTQETFLFNDTIYNNISFGRDDVPLSEVRMAAKWAAADTFIEVLPDGYETRVGERGARLSGGQAQRLALARAIINNPDFLILDEATSHLDSLNEQVIQKTIQAMHGKKTILVVAHRLSTIRNADMIAVVKNGTIVETGVHEDLMQKPSVYKRLFETQSLELTDIDTATS